MAFMTLGIFFVDRVGSHAVKQAGGLGRGAPVI